MEFKQITLDNLEEEHICCAITEKKGGQEISLKKAWMRERIKEGLVFYKLDVRGKVFIEYLPAEYAWCPIEADGYMYIDCFWVSGRYKGQGYGDRLLTHCIEDSKAKGKKGLVVLSSEKKRPFLSDPGYLKHKGFLTADRAEPYFELLFLPFEKDARIPRFCDCAKSGRTKEEGLVLYYTDQCPYTGSCAFELSRVTEEMGILLVLKKIESREAARTAPSPFTTWALFWNGRFLTNELLSEKSFRKLWEKEMEAARKRGRGNGI